MDTALLKTVAQLEAISRNAQSVYKETFRALLKTVEPMDIDDPLVGVITSYLCKGLQCERRRMNTKTLFKEMVRASIAECKNSFSYEDVMRFARLHIELKDKTYKILFDVMTGRSDDGYGDFIDALLLAGPVIMQRVLSKSYRPGENDRVEEDIKTQIETMGLKESEKVANIIIHGENYMRMFMEEGLLEYFHCFVRNCRSNRKHPHFRVLEERNVFSEY